MMRIVELRSDTFTLPTKQMRARMSCAPLGDDVFGEDPSVLELEEMTARLLGKEAALFVPSGTMGNLLALMGHTQPGDEVFLEENSHIYYYEVGGVSRIAQLLPRLFSSHDGICSVDTLKKMMRSPDIHFAPTTLLCLENTHNRLGGIVVPQEKILDVVSYAHSKGLKVHLDGARLMNAAVAKNCSIYELAAPFDSVMVCLSKGLSSPVGSVLVGDTEFITRSRKNRKMLGGGMRQAGVLACCGVLSLTEGQESLTKDHALAKRLAQGLSRLPGIEVLVPPQTNILLLTVEQGIGKLLDYWSLEGIRALAFDTHIIRLVTHAQVSEDCIDYVLEVTERFSQESKE